MLSKEEKAKAKEKLKKFCDYENNLVLTDNILFVGKCENGDVIIGHSTMNWNEQLELKAHLETHIINDMIKENYVTPE